MQSFLDLLTTFNVDFVISLTRRHAIFYHQLQYEQNNWSWVNFLSVFVFAKPNISVTKSTPHIWRSCCQKSKLTNLCLRQGINQLYFHLDKLFSLVSVYSLQHKSLAKVELLFGHHSPHHHHFRNRKFVKWSILSQLCLRLHDLGL